MDSTTTGCRASGNIWDNGKEMKTALVYWGY